MSVERWVENLNKGANPFTKNIKSEEEFANLLIPVHQLYNEYNYKTVEEIFERLQQQSTLEENIRQFIERDKRASGMVLVVGTKTYSKFFVVGNQQEYDDTGALKEVSMKENSIFDLSSVTKLFTCISVLKLIDSKLLQLNDCISDIDSRFMYLKDVTIEDLLSFKVPLKTAKRIEQCQSMAEVQKILFEIKPDRAQIRLYSDMGAMVLKYVIETVTGRQFYDWIVETILKPCEMQDTVIQVVPEKIDRVVSNNFERKIGKAGYIMEDNICKGVISDRKAKKINEFSVQLHGHAGLFSTAGDMEKLVLALLNGKLIDKNWLSEIGINRVGTRNEDGSFTQFHGYMCYSKNPIENNSEVNHWLSGNTFALGGYTGNQLTIDPNNGIFIFLASNRCHNRITNIDKDVKVKRDENGAVLWDNGESYIDNTGYVYARDEFVLKPAVELAMKYCYLEELLEKDGRWMAR